VTITRYGRPVAELRALPADGPRRTPAEAMQWLQLELARLNLPPAQSDGATLVRQMRDECEH
jgi:antitoxin (DNA-binding transcriptional repressor) of toxin-antitoxin stability system